MHEFYEVIVIGGGHAGAEAAWAAANALRESRPLSAISSPQAGDRVAIITMDPSKIGAMSCNPAIGGLAKGQIVREVDALGGLMGLATDATGIQFRMLNMSKGPAVRGPRAQCDKYAYAAEVQRLLSTRPNLDVIAATVDELIVEHDKIVGVRVPESARVVRPNQDASEWNIENRGLARPLYQTLPPLQEGGREGGRARADADGSTHPSTPSPGGRGSRVIRARAVVLTTGTFMRGLMHTGERRSHGGRVGEGSAVGISGMLRALGFDLGRLKTGTPPRLARESIDLPALKAQNGDASPAPFSDLSPGALPGARFPQLPQVACYETATSREAHELIRANLHRAPMYSGAIEAECGPRYCPSIEDKVVKFPGRETHHVFLEPESLHTNEIYCNGISTSLPEDVQERIVHTMPGCERARILKWGYAVEYDMVWPHQIDATGMAKRLSGLFLAGQINGTSGYEEAAGQGLIAGVNAARFSRGEDLILLGRDQAYIGVMMDDLVTKTPREPYRMFTSRAEYRLLLRADNADERLTPVGRELGLIDDLRWSGFKRRQGQIRALREALAAIPHNGKSLAEYARRPEVTAEEIAERINGARNRVVHGLESSDHLLLERIMIDLQYEGYVNRQRAEVKRLRDAEEMRIPATLPMESIVGLRAETRDALRKFRPATLGQAGRLAGVHSADLAIVAMAVTRHRAAHDRQGQSLTT